VENLLGVKQINSGGDRSLVLPETVLPETRMEWISPRLLRVLRCPLCKGALSLDNAKLRCAPCAKAYPVVLGIPDLRIYEDPLIPLEDDYRKGEKVQVQAEKLGFADLVRYYWSLPTYPYTPPELRERFIHHVLTDEARIVAYRDKIGAGGAFLDVGCGTAALVKMAQPKFDFAVGCDVAFRWLLIARRRLQEAGLEANLVCCCADYLPFSNETFDSVASVSLLEHLSDAPAAIHEFARVAKRNGRIFAWTTNRFSLAPEPHVRIWGVGYLPRRWMPAYVKWRSGLAYKKKRLLSCFEIRRFFRKESLADLQFSLPSITPSDWERLNGLERAGARLFTIGTQIPLLRSCLLVVSPVIQVVARRKRTVSPRHSPAPMETVRSIP
jgi:ubiquinone/menaquinone biosynthesis C-methylase UbiE/uncharacterized protein YbaR (Trm112 family)